LLISFSILKLYGQDKTQTPKEILLEAESYFLYEEYSDALPDYLKLLKADPSNDNFNFKIGVCYQNIPYEKDKSIPYLEKAVKDINPDYRPSNIKETKAPIDALFYLGNAYRINNQLDKALATYIEFRKKCNPDIFDISLVDDQIKTISRAKKLESNPIYFVAKNLGETINSRFAETNAVVSADESILIYNVKLQFYDAMYFSVKENGKWQEPVNIIPDLGVDGDVYATSLSHDGKELFIYRSDNYDGNLYTSRFTDGHWNPIKRLNDNINTKYWESHASISSGGKTLYFTSNRKGGYGGLDIYTSTRTDITKDDWGPAVNMGPEINTPFNEETPFISEDGKTLFFSSYGHYNMGGYDIFYSSLLDNGKWSSPLNMGYPMNTSDDDLFFQPVKDGNFAYVCRYYPDENYGKTDIYRVEMFSSQHPRKFLLKGLVNIPNELKDEKFNLTIKLVNNNNHDTIQRLVIESSLPSFKTNLIAGNYQLIVEGSGIQKLIDQFNIKPNQSDDEFTINPKVKPLLVEKPKPGSAMVKIIMFDKGAYKVFYSDNIKINLPLEPGSSVTVDISINNTHIRTDEFIMTSKNQHYNYIPQPGRNVLYFRVISPDNEKSEGKVVINYEDQTDSIANAQKAKELAENQAKLNIAKNFMTAFATGNLKNTLEQLDLAKENISTLDDLIYYLKQNTNKLGYSIDDVDNLLKLFNQNQPLAAELLINAIEYMADSNLKPIVHLAEKSKFDKISDEINFLINKTDSNSSQRNMLLSVTSRLADAGNVYYYLKALQKVSSGNLKHLLDTLDINSEHLNTPESLLDYLIQKSNENGFSKANVEMAFLTIPAFTTSPAILLSSILALSGDGIHNLLSTIVINPAMTNTTAELGIVLDNKATNANIPVEEIVKLIIKANSQAGLKQIIETTKLYSKTGILSKIDSLNFENINSTNELVNYILSRDSDKEVQTELIKIFAQIASVNLVKANEFEFKQKHNHRFSPTEIGIFSVFVILLIIILVWLRRKKKE
jgi:hypothetical protein